MDFDTVFETLTGFPPFRWQARLYDQYFGKGELPAALDLPTGLGKTSVMAIWLIARAFADDEVRSKIPRRLVYVVDRRAVVDQATAEAEKLRQKLDQSELACLKSTLRVSSGSLPISTLRGQFVDNRDWLADPASPAIIVGTVDMIGSRLVFEGYGVSRKMRPYHAGLLGADALIVLDEAHLVPPFEKLLEAIETGGETAYEEDRQKALGPRSAAEKAVIPPFRLLSLSATGRERGGNFFRLTDEDRNDEIIKKRIEAKKAISIRKTDDEKELKDALVKAAWDLSSESPAPIRCLIYCDRRETAQKVFDELSKKAKAQGKGEENRAEVELFTGARRLFEREETARRLKDRLGFIAGEANRTGKPVFLIATSAAEVGVDLDADHMVCDLVAWERMVQRFGRVNRRGEGDAKIIVIDSGEPKLKKAEEPKAAEKQALLNYRSLAAIKSLRQTKDCGVYDASPASLLDLKQRAASNASLRAAIDAATTLAPLRPGLNRALVDAWSMTSLETHTGRPEVAPWLRGWVEEDLRRTSVIWRTHLPVGIGADGWSGTKGEKKEVEAYFEVAPPHASEKLETEPYAVVDWLFNRAAKLVQNSNAKAGAVNNARLADSDQRADAGDSGDGDAEDVDAAAPAEVEGDDEKDIAEAEKAKNRPALKRDDIVAFALSPALELKKPYRLKDFEGDNKIKEALNQELAGALLIVDARIAGLSGGLLDPKSAEIPRTADDGAEWLRADKAAVGTEVPLVKFRITVRKAQAPEDERAAEEHSQVDKSWIKVLEFARRLGADGAPAESLIVEKRRGAADGEDERSLLRPQSLAEHRSWTEQKSKAIAEAVGLRGAYAEALATAARLHDEGKQSKRWQRAFNAHRADETLERPLAKTRGPIDFKLLDGYRHEFGSLSYAEKDEALKKLSPDIRELVLHLIAAHHGRARPIIETRSCEDAPPSALQERAGAVALRFARLQKQWGPWGLAWWEALLRAADTQASRENDEVDRN